MAERERRTTPPYGGVFVPRTRVMTADDVHRALWRMAHEIVERNHGLDDLALVGLQTGGVPLARRLAANLEEIEDEFPPVGTLDVALHRDDIGVRPVLPEAVTDMTFSCPINQVERAKKAMEDARDAGLIKYDELIIDTDVAKVSVVGIGMRSHAGVAATMFKALANEGVNIKVISTSEIKISVLIDRKYMELAVQALHDAFGLDKA